MTETHRHLVFVIGTRAQLIKVAPVVVACERHGLSITLLMTGQHQETMQDMVDEFGIRSPQVQALPATEQSTIHSLLRWFPAAFFAVTLRLKELAKDYAQIDVVVHGDTLSTVIGAIAGRRCGARVVHIESGLASGRWYDPFPEELCRRIVFRFTDIAMCPNPLAAAHMRRYRRARVVETGGNTIFDAVKLSGAWSTICDTQHPYIVVSLHRFQNLYDAPRLRELVELIEQISRYYPVHFVLHPATRNRLAATGLDARLRTSGNVNLSPRLGYSAFLRLAAGAACVLTDGGSNQEELAVLGVPTLVMRGRTERPDGLGANALMEADLRSGVLEFLVQRRFEELRRAPSPPGEHGPSERIAAELA